MREYFEKLDQKCQKHGILLKIGGGKALNMGKSRCGGYFDESERVLAVAIGIKDIGKILALAEHESLDKLFGELVDNGDELVESVMGKYGRPELTQEEANFTLVNYENPDSPDGLPRFLKNIDNCFRNECASLFPEDKDPEIHNLIQEILGTIDKISYLLTLQK